MFEALMVGGLGRKGFGSGFGFWILDLEYLGPWGYIMAYILLTTYHAGNGKHTRGTSL